MLQGFSFEINGSSYCLNNDRGISIKIDLLYKKN